MITLKEMAKIGVFNKQVGETGGYEVWIYPNDPGDKPHFHIINDEEEFSCCVEICSANYFKHEGKEDELNHKLRKSLIHFLKSPHRKLKPKTNWEYLCACWEDNNSGRELPDDIYENMPDYTKLR